MPWAALARSREDASPIDWAGSLDMYDRALAADAHNGTALLWRSIAWLNLGFFDRALADQDRCLAQDPGYQNCRRWKALTLLFAGDTARAIELYAEGGAAGFVWNRADSFVGPLLRRGERVGAILLLKELGATPELNAALLEILAQPDGPRSALADEVVRAALADKAATFSQRVGEEKVHLWLGDYDLVARTPDLGSDSLVHWEPGYPRFRSSPAFKAVVERLDIAAYWREHGYPPQCRAVGKQDFACT